jgi:hypothetical protein
LVSKVSSLQEVEMETKALLGYQSKDWSQVISCPKKCERGEGGIKHLLIHIVSKRES